MAIISKLRDSLRLWLYRKKFDFKNEAGSFTFSDINHVVISKIDGKLGDTQIVTFFIYALKQSYPNLKITILGSKSLEKIYTDTLKVDKFLIVSRRPKREELNLIVDSIEKCDLFVTLEAKFRFHDFYILNRLRPKIVAGINNDALCVNINLAQRNPDSHITQYFADLLKIGGCANFEIAYIPLETDESKRKASAYCVKNQIAIAPWGASKHKHLSDENVVYIARRIVERTNCSVAVLVPPEGNYLKDLVRKSIPADRIVEIPEKIDVFELSSIISLSAALISVDTANVHLACASGIPLFAFYNSNHPELIRLWHRFPARIMRNYFTCLIR